MPDFKFKRFNKTDIPVMQKTFNKAFSDYHVPIKLNSANFQKKIIEKTNICFNNSIGCQFDNKWVGFIFNSINQYENKKIAYNGGTGVIPGYRGNNLTFRMYEHIIPSLIENGIEQCVLEVIADNTHALNAYAKVGFRKSKFMHCVKMHSESKYLDKHRKRKLEVTATQNPDFKAYKSFCEYKSSFLDSLPMLQNNSLNETFLEIKVNEKLAGFMVLNKSMGRIGHIGVCQDFRGQGIGTALVNEARKYCPEKQLYVLNINEKSYGLLSFLLRLGFKNDLDQFELKLHLDKLGK